MTTSNYPNWLKAMRCVDIDKNTVSESWDTDWTKTIVNPSTGETVDLTWSAFPSGWTVKEGAAT